MESDVGQFVVFRSDIQRFKESVAHAYASAEPKIRQIEAIE